MISRIHTERIVLPAVILAALATPLALASGGGGGGGSSSRAVVAEPAQDADYAKAEQAIRAQDWGRAVDLLTQVVARDARNADAYNYLGFAERNRGNLAVAFKYYDRALALNPRHRGVREYLGETYLLSGNLPKAEEQLAALDTLCGANCGEYKELQEKIADYKRQHPAVDGRG